MTLNSSFACTQAPILPTIVALHEYTSTIERRAGRANLLAVCARLRACRHDGYWLWHHSRDVADLGWRLARALGLHETTCLVVRRAGLVHDVGKTYLPVDVLHKKGRLTDAERRILEDHPALGAEVLVDPHLAEIAEVVEQHHEWPSGGGYPARLASAEINPAAKLVSVVDWYAACREPRGYKGERSQQDALAMTWEAAYLGRIDLALTQELERLLETTSWRPRALVNG